MSLAITAPRHLHGVLLEPQRVVGQNVLENLTGEGMLFTPPIPEFRDQGRGVYSFGSGGVEVLG